MPIRNRDDATQLDRHISRFFDAGDVGARASILRDIFVGEIDFQPASGTVPLTPVPANVELPDTGERIATAEGFNVVYVAIETDKTPRVRKAEAVQAARRIESQLGEDMILVMTNPGASQLHFILPDFETSTPTLRRMVVEKDLPRRTAVQQLSNCYYNWQEKTLSQTLKSAYNVEAVTDRFFKEYKCQFNRVLDLVEGFGADEGEDKRLFVQTLFNRLMFVYFVSRKGWMRMPGDRENEYDYLNALWRNYEPDKASTNFYRDRLYPLFFTALNTAHSQDLIGIPGGKFLQQNIGIVPFLNGGLFDGDNDLDKREGVAVPDEAIPPILSKLFDRFNFTVMESTPLDVEVAVDPEMLGKVFEELVTGRHESGSYYTPRPVVSFMCREALKGFLEGQDTGADTDAIRRFVDDRETAGLDMVRALRIGQALTSVTVVDPACGSGAYLVGMLQELVDLLESLANADLAQDPKSVYELKLEIIEHSLYGADIDQFAVNIAMLRLWLSLAVDFDGDDIPALPNLDFKIVRGDSLTGPDPSPQNLGDLFRHRIHEHAGRLAELKRAHMRAVGQDKADLFHQVESAQASLREALADAPSPNDAVDWRVEFAEVFARVGGFHILVMNPPYIGVNRVDPEHLADFKEHQKVLSRVFGFTGDPYQHFFVRALQLLAPSGQLQAITSDSFMTNVTKERLRRTLLATSLKSLMRLPPEVFRAEVYTAITGLENVEPDSEHTVKFLNGRNLSMEEIERAGTLDFSVLTIPIVEYQLAYQAILFEPAPENRLLFADVLANDAGSEILGRRFVPLELVAPVLDTGIHSGNVRRKLFFAEQPDGRQLPRLIQGRQVTRYGTSWASLKAKYRYVDVDYQPDPSKPGIGRGGKTSARSEYWHFCGPRENHEVPERLLMRQTEDEPYVGHIISDGQTVYTDNTLHTLLLTDAGRSLGVSVMYLLGLLNSSAIRYVYRAMTQEERRSLAQVKTTVANRLPIAVPNGDERLAIEQRAAQLVRLLASTDEPERTLAGEVCRTLIREIDTIVEGMYAAVITPNFET